MKKSTLALAIATVVGVSATAQADTTLYGSARVSVDWNNPGLNSSFANFFKDTYGTEKGQYWQVTDNNSRLGVQGSENLGSGVSAIYQYEFGIDVPGGSNYFNNNRPRFVGIKSDDFGSITLGTQYTPYYNVIGYTDTFESIRSFDYFLSGNTSEGTPVLYQRGVANLRDGSTVIYSTPTWYGLSAQGLAQMNGLAGPNSIDSWEANLIYSNSPWFVGGTFLQDKAQEYATGPFAVSQRHSDNEYGVIAAYDNKQFSLAFSWQRYSPDKSFKPYFTDNIVDPNNFVPGREDVNDYTVQGTYSFGNEVLRATYSYSDFRHTSTTVQNVELGLEHSLSKLTTLWVEYLYAKQNLDNVEGVPNAKDFGNNIVSVGIRHDF
jgi:predicted porin